MRCLLPDSPQNAEVRCLPITVPSALLDAIYRKARELIRMPRLCSMKGEGVRESKGGRRQVDSQRERWNATVQDAVSMS